MIPACATPDEELRLQVLRSYAVLDTLPNRALDDITELASQICETPTAMISLVDEDRQWFKAKVGWELQGTPRNISFCGHAIQQHDLMIVPDALLDERFIDNPLVTGKSSVRFYAGAPLISLSNTVLGALCVMDRVPRTLTSLQQRSLRVLGNQVMTQLELHRQTLDLIQSENRLQIVTNNARVGLVMVDRDRRYVYANNACAEIMGLKSSSIIGLKVSEVLPDIYDQISPRLDRGFEGERVAYELVQPGPTGDKTFEVKYEPIKVRNVVTMVVIVITEITGRRQAEAGLRRLAAIVEFSHDAIIGKDLDGVITSWNRGAETIFGYTAAEMIGNSIMKLIPKNLHLEENQILEKIRSGESIEHFETLRKTKCGGLINVSVTSCPIIDSKGIPIGVSKVARDITTQKKAEQQLNLLKTCVSKLNDVVIVTEADLIDEPGPKIVFVNEAFERTTGYPSSDAIGKSPRFLQGKDTEQNLLREIRQALLEKKPIRRSLTNYKKNGEELFVDLDIVPIFDPAGKCTHFVAIQRDITDIRNSEGRYRTLFEHAPDGIFTADPHGNCINANEKVEGLLGYKKADLLNKHLSQFVVESSPDQVQSAIENIKSGAYYHQEWKFRRNNDTSFIAEVMATLMPDGNLLGMIRDVTEKKQAEQQIAEQAAFLDKARDAILVRDLEGKVLFWNQGAQHIYGWTSQEALGQNVREFLNPDPKKFDELNRLTLSRGEWNGELKHLTKEKEEIVIEARWTLICDSEGHPKSVLAINTDITEKKKIEVQFMRAQRMESIGTLAGGVAHDLNNILAPILMSIEVLKELTSGAEARSVLETIELSAKRGAEIVHQVLSFARGLEGQRVELQFSHLFKDLETIAKETFPKDIRMRFSVLSDTRVILGDPTQVHQILLNLCVNARDAMPNGGNLSVIAENCILDEHYAAMESQVKPGKYVTVSVTDSGVGIPPKIIDKIFEPFFTTKGLNKGTGLGLSTVLAIVKSHGGMINVYSELGKGTTFRVYLPAIEKIGGTEQYVEENNLPRGNGETILIVDDESSILAITTQTLQAFGYKVLTATDGADALSVYVQNRNDIAVVLTDMMMPVLDGPATINALMRINPGVRIIGASGLDESVGGVRPSGLPIKHFLTKPYTAGLLLRALKTVLEQA